MHIKRVFLKLSDFRSVRDLKLSTVSYLDILTYELCSNTLVVLCIGNDQKVKSLGLKQEPTRNKVTASRSWFTDFLASWLRFWFLLITIHNH